jgi:hypothetical protein
VINNLLLFLVHPARNGNEQKKAGSKGLGIAAAYHYPTLRDRVIGHYGVSSALDKWISNLDTINGATWLQVFRE